MKIKFTKILAVIILALIIINEILITNTFAYGEEYTIEYDDTLPMLELKYDNHPLASSNIKYYDENGPVRSCILYGSKQIWGRTS